MEVYRVMPYWTQHYLSDEKRRICLERMREELGYCNLRQALIKAGLKQMKATAQVQPELKQELDSMSEKEKEEEAASVGEIVVVHEFIMNKIQGAIVSSLHEIMGPENSDRESEDQALLSVIFVVFQGSTLTNPRLLEEPRKAALEMFRELVGPNGVQEALVGGADFIFQQCLGDIILRDEDLHQLVCSRLSIKFTR